MDPNMEAQYNRIVARLVRENPSSDRKYLHFIAFKAVAYPFPLRKPEYRAPIIASEINETNAELRYARELRKYQLIMKVRRQEGIVMPHPNEAWGAPGPQTRRIRRNWERWARLTNPQDA